MFWVKSRVTQHVKYSYRTETTMSVFILLLCTSCIAALVLYLQYRWRHRRVISAASKLPCPPTVTFFGNAFLFIGSINNLTQSMIKFTSKFKGTFCIWIGPVPIFVVSDPSDVKIILNSSNTSERDEVYKFLTPFLGDGLITAPVSIWKRSRRLINPILHPSNMDAFMPAFNEVGKELADSVVDKAEPLDPRDLIFNSAVDAITRTVLTRSIPAGSQIKKDIQFLLDTAGQFFTDRIFKVYLHADWLFNIIYRKEMKEALSKITHCMDFINDEWKGEEQTRNSAIKHNQEYYYKRLIDYNLMDLFLDHQSREEEDHDWRDEVKTMIAAATHTVVAATSFFLFVLGNDPEIQKKVHAEIKDVMGDSDRDVTFEDLNSMTYISQVIMETIRIYGVIPVILRKATKDVKLTGGSLPAGSRIMIALHAMGWNSDHFPEPDKFLPERFSSMNDVDRHNHAFLPFGAGPRNCIGKIYAMVFMKTEIVHLLRRYRVSTDVRPEDIEYELKLVLFTKTPLPMRFETH